MAYENEPAINSDAVRFRPLGDDEYEIHSGVNYPGEGQPLLTDLQPPIGNLLPSLFKKPQN